AGPEPGGGRPLYAHWAVWAGGAAVLAGVGTWAGLRARSSVDQLDEIRANSEMYEFSEAQAVADRAERRALIANISFGAAAACAIVSGVLFFRGGDERPAERAALVPLLAPDAAGVAASVRF
ncbi:MAG TPA: hypothetical protein VKZ63_17175, partial [Kofleriaceae bacterium]|nr:hypothetical protein [Kofleriaceae bacterium]